MKPIWTALGSKELQEYGTKPELLQTTSEVSIGPIEISDMSQGATAKYWGVYTTADEGNLFLVDMVSNVSTLLLTEPEAIISASLTFDQNGSPVVCYVTLSGSLKLRRFDGSLADYVVEEITTNCIDALVNKDIVSLELTSHSDVILNYIVDGAIFTRLQRDNYEVEYTTPITVGAIQLVEGGTNTQRRFQLEYLTKANTR